MYQSRWIFSLMITLLFLAGCAGDKSTPSAENTTEKLPNIVFLFSDDHSVPDLGCYGNPVIHTPNLDKMAADGLRFTRAYVTSPQCSPSRASIFTGHTPHYVGASRLHANVPSSVPSIVELLQQNGYYTGAYRKVHQKYIQERFNAYYDKGVALSTFFDERPKDQPFFLWFGSIDPHRKYQDGAFDPPHNPADVIVPDYLPDTPEVRKDLAHYYDEVARFDKECGEILTLLERDGLTDNTMVVMSGDNGLPFPRAKGTCYEAGIKVPLLIKWPGKIAPGGVTDELVSLLDLTSTWLEAAQTVYPAMESQSLLGLLTGEQYNSRDVIFSERNWHDNWDPIRTVVGPRYKLIQNYRPEMPYRPSLDILDSPSWESITWLQKTSGLRGKLTWYNNPNRPQVEFYDLQEDPGEWNNLADEPAFKGLVTEHQKVLSDWIRVTNDFLPPVHGAFPPAGRYKDVNPL
jgi:N-sulfoglucosamine sulfohydrolase